MAQKSGYIYLRSGRWLDSCQFFFFIQLRSFKGCNKNPYPVRLIPYFFTNEKSLEYVVEY